MKISGVEKGVLALTLAFLIFLGGYFLGGRNTAQPYTVSVQTQWTEPAQAQPTDAAVQETAAARIERVNINTATEQELQTLPGIGEVRAAAILADREANGPFRIPEDITRVKGIGQGTLEEILDHITVE